MQARQYLKRVWGDFLAEEVKRHNGIPELSMEEINFRVRLADLLENGPETFRQSLQHAAKEEGQIKATEGEILIIFIHGMQLCMRILRNCGSTYFNGERPKETMLEGIRAMIRLVQVQIGSGRQELPTFSDEEKEEMRRIE